MTMILVMLMAYSLIGECFHEIIGLIMVALFTAHHIINRHWWKGLFKGKYNALRVTYTVVDVLLAVLMIAQPVSGILMSKYVFSGLTIEGMSSTSRSVHMACGYWSFILMSFHIGLHLRTVAPGLCKKLSGTCKAIVGACAGAVAAYGVYAFIKRGFVDYLLLRTMFAFFDFNENLIFFFADYLAIMVLFAIVGYLIIYGFSSKKRIRG